MIYKAIGKLVVKLGRAFIVRRYGRVEGVHVPLSIESTANLKIVGDSVFSMTYEYESVNGKAVSHAGKAVGEPVTKP